MFPMVDLWLYDFRFLNFFVLDILGPLSLYFFHVFGFLSKRRRKMQGLWDKNLDKTLKKYLETRHLQCYISSLEGGIPLLCRRLDFARFGFLCAPKRILGPLVSV